MLVISHQNHYSRFHITNLITINLLVFGNEFIHFHQMETISYDEFTRCIETTLTLHLCCRHSHPLVSSAYAQGTQKVQ